MLAICSNTVVKQLSIRELGDVLSGCQDQAVSHELQTTTETSKSQCFKRILLFWQSSEQNGKSTGYSFYHHLKKYIENTLENVQTDVKCVRRLTICKT